MDPEDYWSAINRRRDSKARDEHKGGHELKQRQRSTTLRRFYVSFGRSMVIYSFFRVEISSNCVAMCQDNFPLFSESGG